MVQKMVQKKESIRRKTGAAGEKCAENYLKQCGYQIIACNFRCRRGEIDIIAERRGVLCFIEVKTRRGRAYGLPAEAVNHRKRARLRVTAEYYLLCHPEYRNYALRLDVMELLVLDGKVWIRYLETAFEGGRK